MAVWPATLPQVPLLDGNGLQPVANFVEFSPDVGPPMRRQRTTLAQHVIGWSFNLTAAQVATFRTFFHTTIKGGADSFEADDPFVGDAAEFVFEGQYSLAELGPDVFRMTSQIRRVT